MATLDELVTHRQMIVGGLRMHVAEAGQGPPVVLLHGFPDFWYSWRRQIPALVDAGYRVLAPDLRGYADTESPRGVRAYRMERLVADVAGLLRATGQPALLVGHDWGGAIAWETAAAHPELVARLAVCNMPHSRRFQQGLRTRRQLQRSWYIGFFQLPVIPELLLRAGRGYALRRVLREHATRSDAFTGADLDRYVEALIGRGDLTGPVNYYRAAVRAALRGGAVFGPAGGRVAQPVLVLWGERDLALGAELAEPPGDLVPDARVVRYPEAGHWVHLDEHEAVTAELVRFADDTGSAG